MIKVLIPDIQLNNLNVLQMGLGLNGGGIGLARFLASKVKSLLVTDLKKAEELSSALEALKNFKSIQYHLGYHDEKDFTSADIVFKGAGIKMDNPYIKASLNAGKIVDTDIGYFFEISKNPKIGITGSKGKSTTTMMIYDMMKANDTATKLGGNITVSPFDDFDEKMTSSYYVLELSSWQLADVAMHEKSPHIAVMTTIIPDHLNYYGTMEAYVADKKYIYKFQNENDFLILNYDNHYLKEIAQSGTKSSKICITQNISKIDEIASISNCVAIIVDKTLDRDSYKGIDKIANGANDSVDLYIQADKKAFFSTFLKDLKGNNILVNEVNEIEDNSRKYYVKSDSKKNNSIIENSKYINKKNGKKYMQYNLKLSTPDTIFGKHNRMNILCAFGAVLAADLPYIKALQGLKNFKGVPYRMELVGKIGLNNLSQKSEVRFFNDTTATVPSAVAASVNSFDKPVILIAGGVDKGLPLDEMADAIVKNVKSLYLLEGNGSDKLIDMLKTKSYNYNKQLYKSLEQCIEEAYTEVNNKETVKSNGKRKSIISNKNSDKEYKNFGNRYIILLSPGFASFNLFRNEFHRGDIFNNAVKKICNLA